MLTNKTIILGVSSSIAAYKACEIVSRLKKSGADVWVVMTKEAASLVTPLTFRTLSGNPVITDLFATDLSQLPVPHISLAKKADLILIAPCTANVLGKIANGIADDPLTTIVMASTAPKLIAPAMNCEMWRNSAVQENLEKLKVRSFEFVGPAEGRLACGDDDIGRMSEPEEIVEKALRPLGIRQDLRGKRFLITAGGTQEAIDPVRYITNRSSGKMGYALARVAREQGATVTLISGPTNLSAPLDIKPVKVESAQEMLEAVMEHYSDNETFVMAAAVGDFNFKPKTSKSQTNPKSKIKKNKKGLVLELTPTRDILKTVSQQKGRQDRTLVGFALETENVIANAKKKLKQKDLDLIVANTAKTFNSDNIEFSLIDRSGKVQDYPEQSKEKAARVIISKTLGILN
ncbi:MAG: bifunctional phosphopantothenoylcysteine decarboxylase/phosphopantothenate--cysteine ligase CoaBC [bacterium]